MGAVAEDAGTGDEREMASARRPRAGATCRRPGLRRRSVSRRRVWPLRRVSSSWRPSPRIALHDRCGCRARRSGRRRGSSPRWPKTRAARRRRRRCDRRSSAVLRAPGTALPRYQNACCQTGSLRGPSGASIALFFAIPTPNTDALMPSFGISRSSGTFTGPARRPRPFFVSPAGTNGPLPAAGDFAPGCVVVDAVLGAVVRARDAAGHRTRPSPRPERSWRCRSCDVDASATRRVARDRCRRLVCTGTPCSHRSAERRGSEQACDQCGEPREVGAVQRCSAGARRAGDRRHARGSGRCAGQGRRRVAPGTC